MKKQILGKFTLSLLFFLMLHFMQAQPKTQKSVSTKTNVQAPVSSNTDLCNCINNSLNEYHPFVKELIENIISNGEEKAV